MIQLVHIEDNALADYNPSELETQEWILTRLVTTFSDDKIFLEKVNKITFGLISGK